jgi:hypothetical protein
MSAKGDLLRGAVADRAVEAKHADKLELELADT